MKISQIACQLGRRGGLARARRLSGPAKRRIAAAGGKARALSFAVARRLQKNFQYVRAVRSLRTPAPIVSLKTCVYRLPGVYPHGS
jgi:hypothetical protein